MTFPQAVMIFARAADEEFALPGWGRRNLTTHETDADRDQERNLWRQAGVAPLAARLGAFVQHEVREDGLPVFLARCCRLRAKAWYSCEAQTALELVGIDTDSEAFDLRDCDDHPRTFHGTTFKRLIRILPACGLMDGPNGHSFTGWHYKGVFQCAYRWDAFRRADPTQGMD